MPLQLDFKPSPRLTLMICAVGMGVCAILILLPCIMLIKLLMMTVVAAASIYHILRDALLILPWSYHSISINRQHEVTLIQKSGRMVQVNVCHDTVVIPGFTMMNCQDQAGNGLKKLLPIHVLIVPDMVSAEYYRQLRVFLRWGMTKPE